MVEAVQVQDAMPNAVPIALKCVEISVKAMQNGVLVRVPVPLAKDHAGIHVKTPVKGHRKFNV